MASQLEVLKALIAEGQLHHATYRNQGTLWEGLWFYRRSETGFRGYEVAGSVSSSSPDIDEAHQLTAGTGISVGSFGNG